MLCPCSFLQGCQPQIKRATVFAALSEGIAGVEIAGADQWFLGDDASDAVHHPHRAFEAGPIGKGEEPPDLSLIFVGDKSGWDYGQSVGGRHQCCQQKRQHPAAVAQRGAQQFSVQRLEAVHQPPQSGADLVQGAWQRPLSAPEYLGAGHRRERQGIQRRKQNRA